MTAPGWKDSLLGPLAPVKRKNCDGVTYEFSACCSRGEGGRGQAWVAERLLEAFDPEYASARPTSLSHQDL